MDAHRVNIQTFHRCARNKTCVRNIATSLNTCKKGKAGTGNPRARGSSLYKSMQAGVSLGGFSLYGGQNGSLIRRILSSTPNRAGKTSYLYRFETIYNSDARGRPACKSIRTHEWPFARQLPRSRALHLVFVGFSVSISSFQPSLLFASNH
jgi:hypothetical protein